MKTISIQMSDEQRTALESVAEAYGTNHEDLITRLIAERYKELKQAREQQGEDDFRWDDHHDEILAIVAHERDPITTQHIAEEMRQYEAPFWRTLFPRALNQLVRNGYLIRFKSGYVATAKGRQSAAL